MEIPAKAGVTFPPKLLKKTIVIYLKYGCGFYKVWWNKRKAGTPKSPCPK